MATHGIKVSRNGFDVKTASDKQLAFSSEAPLLPIEAEGSESFTSGSQTSTLYTHNLGYVPVFFFWVEVSGKLYQLGTLFPYNVYATDTILKIDDYLFDNLTVHWKVFRRPLLVEYTSDNINSTDATEKDSGDFGLFVSLPGKDISSTDKRDFGIRSDVRQLIVHKTGYTGKTQTETITHSLGYKPMYWLYIEQDARNPTGAYSLITSTDDFLITITETTFKWEFFGVSEFRFAYLLFKDPINLVG